MKSEKEKAAKKWATKANDCPPNERDCPYEGECLVCAFLAGWDERDKEVAELKTKLAWAENGARLR